MPDVDILRINETDYKVHDSDGRALIAPEELTSTAAAAHAVGEPFVYDGKLYHATATISIGDTIVTTGTGANCEEVPGGVTGEVADLDTRMLLLSDAVPNTVQAITFDNAGNVSTIVHANNGVTVRTDTFTVTETTITEARVLAAGGSLTLATDLTTLQTTVTYTAA